MRRWLPTLRAMRKKTGIRTGLGLLLLAVMGLGAWLGVPEGSAKNDTVSGRGELAAKPPAVAAPQAAASVAAARAESAAPTPPSNTVLRTGLDPLQLAQIEAQWCSHAKLAHAQAVASIKQGHPEGTGDRPDVARLQAQAQAEVALPTTTTRFAVRRRLLAERAQQLRRQGGERAQATALMLEMETVLHSELELQVLQTLIGMARASGDPYVVSIGLQMNGFCASRVGCSPLPQERWSQVEPGNLLAWLPAATDTAPPSEGRWQGLASARYAKVHEFELVERLLNLVPAQPGLAQEVALEYLDRQFMAASYRAMPTVLVPHCAAPGATAAHKSICLKVAELLWSEPKPRLVDRLVGLGLAEIAGAIERAPWADRARIVKGLKASDKAAIEAVFRPRFAEAPGCDSLPLWRQHLSRLAQRGDYLALQDSLGKTVLP